MANSVLFLDYLIDDSQDLLKQEDDWITGVKDQIKLLQRLLILHSSINDMGSSQHSGIGELKEPLMTAYLVKDAPLWYVITDRHGWLISMDLQVITETFKLGDLKVTTQLLLEEERKNEATKGCNSWFGGYKKGILDQLDGGRESLQVISIIGMGGLGKTTLAKKV